MNLKTMRGMKRNNAEIIPLYKLFKFLTNFELFLYFIGILANILSGISIMILQLLIGNIVGGSITNLHADDFHAKLILYLFIFVVIVFILKYVSRWSFGYITIRQGIRIRSLYLKRMLSLDVSWHDLHRTDEFVSTISEDIIKFQEGTGETLGVMIFYFVKIIMCLSASFVYLWKQTLIIVYILPFVIIINICCNFVMLRLSSDESRIYNKANSIAEEVFTLIKIVIAYCGHGKEVENYENKLNEAKDVNIKKYFCIGLNTGLLNLFSNIFISVQYWYATTLMLNYPKYDITDFIIVFFNGYVAYQGVSHLPYFINKLTSARASAYKIFTVIESELNINKSNGNGIKLDFIKGEIEFQDVEFLYPSRPSKRILNGLSFKIKHGETIALVGESGCGKSTCIQLLQRFYDTTTGKIIVDGIDIKDYDIKWFRDNLATVEQEPSLFNTTIVENIKYGHVNATQDDIERAAKQANIHDYIMQLPQQYDTVIGENGCKLSGGQRQRIAIARAIVKKPSILLLDEATSALDSINELQIQETVFTGNENRTTIIVAHNLSTIRCVDKIIYIKDGVAVEIGTHDELIAKKSHYYQLINAQREATQLVPVLSTEDNAEEYEKFNSNVRCLTYATKKTDKFNSVTLMTALKTLYGMSKNKLIYVGIAIVFILISALLKTIPVIYFGPLMMAFYNIENVDSLYFLHVYVLCVGIAGVIICLTSIITFILMAITFENLIVNIRKHLFNVLLNKHVNGLFDVNVGSSCVKLCNQPRLLQLGLNQPVIVMIEMLLMLIIYIIACLYLQWRQGLIILTSIIISLTVTCFLHKLVRMEHVACDTVLNKSSNFAVEAIRSIRTIVALNAEEKIHKLYKDELIAKLDIFDKSNRFIALTFALKFAVNFLGFLINTFCGRLFVTNNQSTVEIFATIMLIHININDIMRTISFTATTVLKAVISSKEIVETLTNHPEDKQIDRYQDLHIDKGSLRYENIYFSYPSMINKNILNNINLSINEGKTIALIGSSGCGKTTLVSLLLRFFEPTSGTITLNNKDISSMHMENWRKLIGIVFQEPYLFNRTIAENIAYGINDRSVQEQDVIEAAKSANIHNFIKSLPLGYETIVGTRGIQLSGGQKQRIAIARALIRNPQILILDEATSSLDKQNEKIVQESLNAVKKGRTCIIIAHRLTTIENADLICVLNDGKIMEYSRK